MDLNGTVVIVTGASRGLGAAFAEVLGVSGAVLAVCARDAAGLDSACKHAKECYAEAVDVADYERVNSFVAAVVKKFGRIDVLVNNAGAIHPRKNVEELSNEDYKSCMATNVDGAFYFAKAVLPVMRRQNSGVIVNISSGAGKRAHGGLSAYSMSKFAVEGLTQSVALEVEKTGIKCFALCPGGINTPMRQAVFGDAAQKQSPSAVAGLLREILEEKVSVPNGADVRIRDGKITLVDDVLRQ